MEMSFASNLDILLEQKLSHVVPLMEPYPQTLPMMMSNAMELKVHLKAASISMFMTVEALRVQVLSAREMPQLLQFLWLEVLPPMKVICLPLTLCQRSTDQFVMTTSQLKQLTWSVSSSSSPAPPPLPVVPAVAMWQQTSLMMMSGVLAPKPPLMPVPISTPTTVVLMKVSGLSAMYQLDKLKCQ